MKNTTAATNPTAREGLAVSRMARPAPSLALLSMNRGVSPRAEVAFSFLHSLEWLSTKLHAIFSRTIRAQASPLALPHYDHRQIS